MKIKMTTEQIIMELLKESKHISKPDIQKAIDSSEMGQFSIREIMDACGTKEFGVFKRGLCIEYGVMQTMIPLEHDRFLVLRQGEDFSDRVCEVIDGDMAREMAG